jgi:hypothetical protein
VDGASAWLWDGGSFPTQGAQDEGAIRLLERLVKWEDFRPPQAPADEKVADPVGVWRQKGPTYPARPAIMRDDARAPPKG